jgi:small subunit ribosomal protein S6
MAAPLARTTFLSSVAPPSGRSRRRNPRKESRLRDYELVYVIRPSAAEEDVNALTERVQGWISGDGGEIQKVNPWGRRRLAYPIDRFREGMYVQINFRTMPNALSGIERQLKLSEDVIRYLLVRPAA